MTTLFHVSDLHFGYEDGAALDWFVREVERERPAAVICTGDLTMRGTAREFARAAAWLSALPVPVSVEPGNHDVPYYWNPVARLFTPYRHYRALEAAVERELRLPDIAVVPLKTVARAQWRLNWSKGRVARGDLDIALGGLAHNADKGLRLIACHHPLIDAGTRGSGSTRGGRQALAALVRSGANAVLSGHVHDAFDRVLDVEGRQIRIIGAGTLSQRLRATRPSFNRLTWDGAALAVSVETLA